MKRCASCGHEYPDTKPACPSCFYTGWTHPREGTEAPPLPEHPFPCAQCNFVAEAGTARCPSCGAALRPPLVTLIGGALVFGSPVAFLAILYAAWLHNFWFLWEIPWCVGGVLIGRRLLLGHYWAWEKLRLLVFSNAGLLFLFFAGTATAGFITNSAMAWRAAQNFIGVLLLFGIFSGAMLAYLNTDRAKAYCSVDKPVEVVVIPKRSYTKWTS